LRRDDGHPPENPDAEALGLFATRLIDIEGYEASREFIGRIFLHTGWKDASRWAWIQARICEALGAARVEAAYSQLDALYLAAEHKSVRYAAFKALTQIKGNEFCSREVERMMGLLEASEKRMPAGFKDRFEMFLIACPSGEMAFDFLESVMKFGEDRGVTYPLSLSGNVMLQLAWRRPYQLEAGIDEKLLILSRFERTDLLGVVKSLGYEVGDVFEGTNDAHVKHVLVTRIDSFVSSGWSKREGYAQSAFTTLIGAYCKVSIDPSESLRMFLNVWYPRHHSWALGELDFRLRCLLQFHLARTATWGPTHERAFDALCQRIEGTGALAYGGKMADTKDIADACAYVPFLQMKQLLLDRIQITEDAEARKVYESALEAWKKRHEK
jgi:hypothetical protein